MPPGVAVLRRLQRLVALQPLEPGRVLGALAHALYGLSVFIPVMAVGIAAGMLLRRMVRRTLQRVSGVPGYVADLAGKALYYLVVAMAAVAGLGLAGVDVTGFAFAGSLLGVALGFAAQTVASNFFSGFFLYIDKPMERGDMVELAGLTGRVIDVTMFSTRIETLDGTVVRIPNEDVFKAMIVNYNKSVAVRIGYRVGISYRSNIDKAINAIRRAVESYPYTLAEPEPAIYVESLDDSAVALRVYVWVPSWRRIEAQRTLLERIKKALDREGIEIPFPQRVIWLRIESEAEADGESVGALEEALRGAPRSPRRAAEEMGIEQA